MFMIAIIFIYVIIITRKSVPFVNGGGKFDDQPLLDIFFVTLFTPNSIMIMITITIIIIIMITRKSVPLVSGGGKFDDQPLLDIFFVTIFTTSWPSSPWPISTIYIIMITRKSVPLVSGGGKWQVRATRGWNITFATMRTMRVICVMIMMVAVCPQNSIRPLFHVWSFGHISTWNNVRDHHHHAMTHNKWGEKSYMAISWCYDSKKIAENSLDMRKNTFSFRNFLHMGWGVLSPPHLTKKVTFWVLNLPMGVRRGSPI